ncbi:hypothetical protein [Reyranella sp.]|uniref:hypothetical protein n=1 Tax=Reyranella sp. TaxID=1929291 RepID=UPI00262EAE16|nr:hypothetical protein [Reyranella sp.]
MADWKTTTYPRAVDRRAILATFADGLCLPAVATVPSRLPAPDPLDFVRRQADLLADMLGEAHGGAWAATVERGFVLVQREGGAQ